MKKWVIAATAAVLIAGSSAAVYAQHRHHHPRFSAEDRSAFVDARIAAVKAGLKLTPEQDKLWPVVEQAVRDFAKQRIDRANAWASERDARRAERERGPGANAQPPAPPDPVARLRERADAMASNAAGLKRIADAADPLYKTLDDGQKRRLAVLTRMGGQGHHGWRRDGGFDRGDIGRDGPREGGGRPGNALGERL